MKGFRKSKDTKLSLFPFHYSLFYKPLRAQRSGAGELIKVQKERERIINCNNKFVIFRISFFLLYFYSLSPAALA